ncbi:hypothetical protein CRENBAI_022320 [Crenichthys baileyi]|uniref:Uncharacterized protein n=1 Tax=Crenichthys baileyi TaxID=28760 RepID=A0AAV9RWG1_9TELE
MACRRQPDPPSSFSPPSQKEHSRPGRPPKRLQSATEGGTHHMLSHGGLMHAGIMPPADLSALAKKIKLEAMAGYHSSQQHGGLNGENGDHNPGLVLDQLPFMMMSHPLIPGSLAPASVTMAMGQMNRLSTLASMANVAQLHANPPARAPTSVIKERVQDTPSPSPSLEEAQMSSNHSSSVSSSPLHNERTTETTHQLNNGLSSGHSVLGHSPGMVQGTREADGTSVEYNKENKRSHTDRGNTHKYIYVTKLVDSIRPGSGVTLASHLPGPRPNEPGGLPRSQLDLICITTASLSLGARAATCQDVRLQQRGKRWADLELKMLWSAKWRKHPHLSQLENMPDIASHVQARPRSNNCPTPGTSSSSVAQMTVKGLDNNSPLQYTTSSLLSTDQRRAGHKLPAGLHHAPFIFPEGLSSIETLLTNIQGLLRVAIENARAQEKQDQLERTELKMELVRERELRETLERQLSMEQKNRVLIQKRLKKEKRSKRKLQEALEEEVKLRDQAEHTLLHTASTHIGHQSLAAPPHTESMTQDVDGSGHDDSRLDGKATQEARVFMQTTGRY